MKTYKNLYPAICSWDNLYAAYRRARAGKRGRAAVAAFEWDLEGNLVHLQDDLLARTYCPGGYASFYIHEPKRRLVSAAPFRDRVVHHALCRIIEPIFERRFIHDSYANRRDKGTHRALDRCQEFARRHHYVLACDVVQFFPSIDHAILRQMLSRVLADGNVMWLIDRILNSGVGVLSDVYNMCWFPGDDLLAATRPRGLPIGNLTSQFWANVYLDHLDQFVKRELKCRAYVRYVDDLLLFADSKACLGEWRAAIIDHLRSLRLVLHESSCQSRPVTEGIPFLGFVVYPDHRRLKGRKVVAFRRRFKARLEAYRQDQIDLDQVHSSVLGWIGHAKHGDTWGLRSALFGQAIVGRPRATENHRGGA